MAPGAFATKLGKAAVLFGSKRQIFIVPRQELCDTLLFLRGIEGPGGNVIHVVGFVFWLPGHELTSSDAIKPGVLPSHESLRNQFTGEIRIPGGQELPLMKGKEVARAPRNERQERREGHDKN